MSRRYWMVLRQGFQQFGKVVAPEFKVRGSKSSRGSLAGVSEGDGDRKPANQLQVGFVGGNLLRDVCGDWDRQGSEKLRMSHFQIQSVFASVGVASGDRRVINVLETIWKF